VRLRQGPSAEGERVMGQLGELQHRLADLSTRTRHSNFPDADRVQAQIKDLRHRLDVLAAQARHRGAEAERVKAQPSLIQFRAGDLARELEQRVREDGRVAPSQVARRDLERYYQLMAASLSELAFNESEAYLVAFAVSQKLLGRPIAVHMLHYAIAGTVDEAIRSRSTARMMAAWADNTFGTSLNVSELTEWIQDPGGAATVSPKLRLLTPAQALAIYDAVERLDLGHFNNLRHGSMDVGLWQEGA
jgi:hypothetical protein